MTCPRLSASTLRLRLFCLSLCFVFLLPTTFPAAQRCWRPSLPASLMPALATAPPAKEKGRHREGGLLVRFRQTVAAEQADILIQSKGARRKAKLRGRSRVERLEVSAGQDLEALAAGLRLDPAVELAEPNFLVERAQVIPGDARFAEQWALRNTGAGEHQAAGSDIRASQAWQATTGVASTVVAIIDGGVDFSHPDLTNNRWRNTGELFDGRDDDRNGYANDLHGWDWVADSGEVKDEQGHGTAVAGLIAAEGNNNAGVAGVMWRASLMSLRVLDAGGTGDVASAVEAIDYAVVEGAHVINCSWGTEEESQALREAIARAAARGVVVVASAGNGGRDNDARGYYPASYDLPNVIAVAATDGMDNPAGWSNRGAARVHVAAPGVGLLSTAKGGGFEAVDGTSASAALGSGVAGLVKTLRPALKPERVREAVVRTARSVSGLEGKVSAGGVVDAAAALAAVSGWPSGPDFDIEGGTDDPAGGEETNAGGNGGSNGNGQGGEGNGGAGGGQDHRPVPLARKGKFRKNQPNLDELRRRPSDPLRAATPIRSSRRDYVRGEPVKEPGGAISADFVSTGRYAGGTLSVARLDPSNRTGAGGEDLFSGNFNWTLPLVGLPGRSGLDLGLSLSYNSLVWTKLGSASIFFDEDRGFPSPGFRLGFPVVQAQFYNETTGKNAYLLVTPSGARVELRQTASGSSVYEAADSSYLQLIDYGATKLVRSTDGTQLSYAADGAGQFVCMQVKDRNGNFISVAHNAAGRITSVTDTLGRVISFNYDSNNRLSTITQARGVGQQFQWAAFGYTNVTVSPSFPGMWVYGPYNQTLSLLTHVWTSDSALHQFTYNPFGQVYRVARKAPSGALLSQTTYNLPTTSAAHSDCPRFTERRDWVAEWNGDDGGTYSASEETVTTFGAEAGDVQTVTMPDGTTLKEFNHTAGWQRGLTYQTETWSGGARRKWTTLEWEQDAGPTFRQNPRVNETNVRDAEGNRRRRTTVEWLCP